MQLAMEQGTYPVLSRDPVYILPLLMTTMWSTTVPRWGAGQSLNSMKCHGESELHYWGRG